MLSSINYVKSDGFLATSFTDILDVGQLTADSVPIHSLSAVRRDHLRRDREVPGRQRHRNVPVVRPHVLLTRDVLLFSYVRRLYTEWIALIATAMFSTSLLWMRTPTVRIKRR